MSHFLWAANTCSARRMLPGCDESRGANASAQANGVERGMDFESVAIRRHLAAGGSLIPLESDDGRKKKPVSIAAAAGRAMQSQKDADAKMKRKDDNSGAPPVPMPGAGMMMPSNGVSPPGPMRGAGMILPNGATPSGPMPGAGTTMPPNRVSPPGASMTLILGARPAVALTEPPTSRGERSFSPPASPPKPLSQSDYNKVYEIVSELVDAGILKGKDEVMVYDMIVKSDPKLSAAYQMYLSRLDVLDFAEAMLFAPSSAAADEHPPVPPQQFLPPPNPPPMAAPPYPNGLPGPSPYPNGPPGPSRHYATDAPWPAQHNFDTSLPSSDPGVFSDTFNTIESALRSDAISHGDKLPSASDGQMRFGSVYTPIAPPRNSAADGAPRDGVGAARLNDSHSGMEQRSALPDDSRRLEELQKLVAESNSRLERLASLQREVLDTKPHQTAAATGAAHISHTEPPVVAEDRALHEHIMAQVDASKPPWEVSHQPRNAESSSLHSNGWHIERLAHGSRTSPPLPPGAAEPPPPLSQARPVGPHALQWLPERNKVDDNHSTAANTAELPPQPPYDVQYRSNWPFDMPFDSERSPIRPAGPNTKSAYLESAQHRSASAIPPQSLQQPTAPPPWEIQPAPWEAQAVDEFLSSALSFQAADPSSKAMPPQLSQDSAIPAAPVIRGIANDEESVGLAQAKNEFKQLLDVADELVAQVLAEDQHA